MSNSLPDTIILDLLLCRNLGVLELKPLLVCFGVYMNEMDTKSCSKSITVCESSSGSVPEAVIVVSGLNGETSDSVSNHVLKGVPGRPELAIVKHGEIKYKIEKKITVKDRYKNVMTVKDVVRVTEGPSKGKQGPVMHIYKGVLFLHDRHNVEHAGFVCVKCSSCVLSGGSYSGADRIVDSFSRLGNSKPPAHVPPSPRRFQRADLGYNSGSGGRHLSGRGARGNDLLVGAYVRVRLGPYKGYRVNRDAIADGNDNVATPSQYNMGSQTPVHPSRTPLHPCMTPMRDSGATPIHNGMRTPMRDRAWNPYTPMSPPRKSFARGAAAEFALKVGLASHPPLGFAVGAPLTFRSVTDSSLGSQAIHIAVALVAELVGVAELAVVLEGCSTHCSGHQTLFEN
ncbi:hypothetical protein F2Q70_00008322 [Brassica cretica]|uniref:KOW domain-containing protein n=1 Tax=Brassica cretica TaxID=69181 RepID=A0A8S9M2C2_BRACR|nr:hypothetical protein F2Q70_00008322 [Brassica cretica]